jgi:hypothetical protein
VVGLGYGQFVGPLNIRNDFHPRVAVFDYSVLRLLRVKRLFVGRIAKLSSVDVHYGGHTNYTCFGSLLCPLYNYAYRLTHLKQRALLVRGLSRHL